ncbi:MAG: sigma-70 family RNA polymerase sigma factor [Bryobacteraceae bacterium]
MSSRDELYDSVLAEFGAMLDRLAAGYEADPERRRDLRQEIHLQVWRSLEIFDARCAMKTWVFRVGHNAAVSYVNRERRARGGLVRLEDIEIGDPAREPDVDRERAIEFLWVLVRKLKPLDRQIMISYLEGLDNPAIAAVTGLTPANVGMKVHRIKKILAQRFHHGRKHG